MTAVLLIALVFAAMYGILYAIALAMRAWARRKGWNPNR